MPTTRPQVE